MFGTPIKSYFATSEMTPAITLKQGSQQKKSDQLKVKKKLKKEKSKN